MPMLAPLVVEALPEIYATLATTAVSYGVSKLTQPSAPKINIPPPPGAAMISPTGAQAASDIRRRQAQAGGIAATQAGAGPQGPTSEAKSLLGS